MTWQTTTNDLTETIELAATIGAKFRGGECIELVSDLGGGKTAFVRGLAKGMGSKDQVASPTFTISREYRAGALTLYHFDFYRLQDPGIIANEIAEALEDPQAIVAVEWSDIVAHVLPVKRLTVHIVSTGENERKVIFTGPDVLQYLLPKEF